MTQQRGNALESHRLTEFPIYDRVSGLKRCFALYPQQQQKRVIDAQETGVIVKVKRFLASCPPVVPVVLHGDGALP